jgi:hypothetical protein
MTTPAHLVLERPVFRPTFGLACRCDSTGRRVVDGLRVRVAAVAGPHQSPAVTAAAGPSGVHALHRLPVAGATAAVVRIVDAAGRFLPTRLRCALPLPPTPGLNGPACVAGDVPLFLRPDQPAPAGLFAVRAALWDATADAPAAFALLLLREPGSGRLFGRGLADERGQVIAAIAPGEPIDADGAASPPLPQPAARRRWALQVELRYDPLLARHVDAGFGTRPTPESQPWPDLCELLAQPVRPAFAGLASPPSPLGLAILRQGEPLVLAADAGGLVVVHPA